MGCELYSHQKNLLKLLLRLQQPSLSTVHATVAVTLATFSVQDWSCPVCLVLLSRLPNRFLNYIICS
ncbi:hypothetical protein HID58_092054 [Brassica napus]|uniref:Uncharacterized protein n=1 Tax=Brassica napus TaxID=3708 RepID=A0ABQ7WXQ3_BRANA|nr:hypothetical protein HID58_092054 [Brassica napus]